MRGARRGDAREGESSARGREHRAPPGAKSRAVVARGRHHVASKLTSSRSSVFYTRTRTICMRKQLGVSFSLRLARIREYISKTTYSRCSRELAKTLLHRGEGRIAALFNPHGRRRSRKSVRCVRSPRPVHRRVRAARASSSSRARRRRRPPAQKTIAQGFHARRCFFFSPSLAAAPDPLAERAGDDATASLSTPNAPSTARRRHRPAALTRIPPSSLRRPQDAAQDGSQRDH